MSLPERRTSDDHEPYVEGRLSPQWDGYERDRQAEIARRYRPDGSLEAERLRIRERERRKPPIIASGNPGFWPTFAGGVAFYLVGAFGSWAAGHFWGVLVALFAFTIFIVVGGW